jgi:hypothetical protein
MAGVTENYSKFEVCVVVRFLQAEGIISEIHHNLMSVYSWNTFWNQAVKPLNEGDQDD